jgi:cytochrome c551
LPQSFSKRERASSIFKDAFVLVPDMNFLRTLLLLMISSLLILSCTTDPKFQQYYVQGEQLYIKHCSNCHQKNGKGLGLVYPPVDQSDYMDKYFEDVICLMKYGKNGELVVNGKKFNQSMPGIPMLTDLEVAEIATYLYNTWERERGLVDVKEVVPIVAKCQH